MPVVLYSVMDGGMGGREARILLREMGGRRILAMETEAAIPCCSDSGVHGI